MRKDRTVLKYKVPFLAFALLCATTGSVALAVESQVSSVAVPVQIEGDVFDGAVVVYDPPLGGYRLSREFAEENIFGVVVDDPVLYVEDAEYENIDASSTRPVVRFGEAYVVVSDIAGEVESGDLITSSRIVGAGQKLSRSESAQIIGFALEPARYGEQDGSVNVDGTTVRLGRVLIALRIGYYDAERDRNTKVDELLAQLTASTTAGGIGEKEGDGFDTFLLFRYILGSFVAITAVILALRRFGDLFAQSIISVGRNPLARSQIRSILVWNAVLIVIVSGVGLGIGVAIIAL